MQRPLNERAYDELPLKIVYYFTTNIANIGDKIAEIHRNRFANDPALAELVENLTSYEGERHRNQVVKFA